MPWFPNPNGGAPIQADTNPNPAGGTLGYYSDPGYNGPPPGGATGSTSPSAPTATVNTGASQLGAGINSLLGAIASGNKQAFDEAVRQFNQTFGLDTQKFAESVRQYNEGLAVTQAGLTGTYQGQETQQAQQQAANIAAQVAGLTGYYTPPAGVAAAGAAGGLGQQQYITARTQQLQGMGWSPATAAQTAASEWAQGFAQSGNVAGGMPAGLQVQAAGGGPPGSTITQSMQNQIFNQQLSAINAAAALQANPFRQQQVLGQLGRVLGGQGVAGFSAPNTVQGVGTAGGTGPNTGMAYMQQMIDDIRNPGANQASVNSVLEGIPTPNRINSADFLRSAPSTQNMILQGMQEKYGLDPSDSLQQIKNTLPSFQAPSTFGTIKG